MSLNPVYGCNPRKEKQQYEFHQHSPPILNSQFDMLFRKGVGKSIGAMGQGRVRRSCNSLGQTLSRING